ncbi:MAG: general secretion pathway protein GspK [Rhodobacteraceae bacterium]|nr:general secretion pathway protein GspK [Paracoccaceae bacterium]
MQAMIEEGSGWQPKGIILFIVISALLILAVLTQSITAQLMVSVSVATSATSQPYLPKLDGRPFTLEISGQMRTFALHDVNGLIDINSASRGLLTAFLEQIGSGNHLESILEQCAAKPFSSVEEFSQRLSRANTVNLNRLLTVNSGRHRINNQTAPIELLQI